MAITLEEILSRLPIQGGSAVGGSSQYASFLPILNSQGVLDPSFFNGSIAVTEVADQAAKLALTGVNIGDVVKQASDLTAYVLRVQPSSNEANWTSIGSTYANSSTGVSYDPTGTNLSAVNVQTAITELWTKALITDAARTSTALVTFNRTGAPFAVGSNATGQLVAGLNSDLLDGQHGAYYRDAANLNAGILPTARLSGTYPISVSGSAAVASVAISAQEADHAALADDAAHADLADNATNAVLAATATNALALGTYAPSYFLDATNLSAGFLPTARFNDTSHGNRAGGALHALATIFAHGFLSKEDKFKIDSLEAGAEPNQNAFSTIKVGGSTLVADSESTLFELSSLAPEIILALDTLNKKVTIDFDLGSLLHADLGGLDADDHTQYVHLANNRTITAVHQFNPTSANAAFTLGINARDNLIIGLNAEKLNGRTDLYFQNASNLITGTVPVSRLTGTYNISISGTAAGGLPLTGGTLTGPLIVPSVRVTGLANPVAALATDSSGNLTAADSNLFYSDAAVRAVVASMFGTNPNIDFTYDALNEVFDAALHDISASDLLDPDGLLVNTTNVLAVLTLGAGLTAAANILNTNHSTTATPDKLVMRDATGAIAATDITGTSATITNAVVAGSASVPNASALTVRNYTPGNEALLMPATPQAFATKYFVEQQASSHLHPSAIYDVPVTEVALAADRLNLTGLRIGELVHAASASNVYALVKYPESAVSSWVSFTPVPTTLAAPGFISANDRGELLKLATLVESQAAAGVFCPAIRVTEPLKGSSSAANNYTNSSWRKYGTRSVQVRGRTSKSYFLLLSFKGWVKKQHRWEFTYYKNGTRQAAVLINAFTTNQPARGTNYSIEDEYEYVDKVVPIFVDGQSTITTEVYAFDGKFTNAPSYSSNDLAKVAFPGIPPYSTGSNTADPFNGGFMHIEGKGVWSANPDEPYQPYAPDLFPLQSEGEPVGGGLTYYPAGKEQDHRIYDGEQIYDIQDKETILKISAFADPSQSIPKYQIIAAPVDDTTAYEKAHIRCNYTVFNKLAGFNGFLRPDSAITSGKGLTRKLSTTADLSLIPLTSPKLTENITFTANHLLIKSGVSPIDIDVTGVTNMAQLVTAMNSNSLLTAAYNPVTDRIELHDDTPAPDQDTAVPPTYYDVTNWASSQAMRVLRIGFGGIDPFTGASLPVASGLRTNSSIATANFNQTVSLISGSTAKFNIDDHTISYSVDDVIDDVIVDLDALDYSLEYKPEANEFVLKRKDGTTSDYSSISAPRIYDVKGNLITAMGLDKESHGNANFPVEAVHRLLIQDDGVIAAGNFKNYCGVTSAGLAKLKFDGKADPFFNTGIGFDGAIWAVSPAGDGTTDLLVGGFDPVSFNGYNRKCIFRIKQTGAENTRLNLPLSNLSDDNQGHILDVVLLNAAGDFAVLTPRKLLVYNTTGTLLRQYEGTKSFHGMVKYREEIGQTYFMLTSQAYVGPTTTQKFNGIGEPLGLRLMTYDHTTHEVTIDPIWAQVPVWNGVGGYGPGAGTGAEASCAYPITGGVELNRYVICGNRGAWWGTEIEDDANGNTAWNERGSGNLLLESENFKVAGPVESIIQSTANSAMVITAGGQYRYATSNGYKLTVVTAGIWDAALVSIEYVSNPGVEIYSFNPTRDGVTNQTVGIIVDPAAPGFSTSVFIKFQDIGVTTTGTFNLGDTWVLNYAVPVVPTAITQVTSQPNITVGAISGYYGLADSNDTLRALTYSIVVTAGGAWGTADISITPSVVSAVDTVQTINDVQIDTDYALGTRGLKFRFLRPVGTDTLVLGNTWKVAVWPWQEGGLGLDPIAESTDGYGRTFSVLTNDTANSSEVGYVYQDFDATNVRYWANGAPIANTGGVNYVMIAQIKKDSVTTSFPYIGLEFGTQSAFNIGCRLNTATGAFDADIPGHDGAAVITVVGNKPSNPDFWIVKLNVHDTGVPNTRVRPVIYPAYTDVFVQGAKTPVTRSITLYGLALQYEPWVDDYVRTTTQPIFVTSGSTANNFRGMYKIGLEGSLRGKAWAGFATYIKHDEAQSHPIPFAVDRQNRIYFGGPVYEIQKADTTMQTVTPWRLYRLTEQGKFDKEYQFNDTVTSAAITSADKLVVGGRFTCYNKRAVGKLAFLTLDGEILEDITPKEDDIIVSATEPDVILYPDNKDKLWLDISVEPPLLKVYDDTDDIWISALAASKRVSDPVFRTTPANTFTDPAEIFIDVPGFTVKASGWTAEKDVQVTYRVNDQYGTPVAYDPAVGILLGSAGSYTIYADAIAPASAEWFNSRVVYQYFTIRAQCLQPAIVVTSEGSGERVAISTAAGTSGSFVQYYTYPVGFPPQTITWLPIGLNLVSLDFLTNKNITVKAKATKPGMRDSLVVTQDVTVTVGASVITPKSPVASVINYIDRVGLVAGTKGTGVLYSIGPSTGALEPTIDNYLHHNTGNVIVLASASSDVDLMNETLQEAYFGGPAGISCTIKARTVITEMQGLSLVPIVEQSTTTSLVINREAAPTLTPNGYLTKIAATTTFPIAVTAPTGKTVKFDMVTFPTVPDTDVTESDTSATWNGTNAYIADRVITADVFTDFTFRVRVFNTGTVPSQRITVAYYWKRTGPTITLVNDPTYGYTKFTITPALSVAATHKLRYTFNAAEILGRTTGTLYTAGSEIDLQNVADGFFVDNALSIRVIEYDTDEAVQYDAITTVTQARVVAASPTTVLYSLINLTEITEAGPNVLTYDTLVGDSLSLSVPHSSVTTLLTYNNTSNITTTAIVDKTFTGSLVYNFTPPLAAVNTGELDVRIKLFRPAYIPSRVVPFTTGMRLPPIVFDPPSYTDFTYEGDVKLLSGLSTAIIHYTVNNTAATATSAKYAKPIRLRANAYIRAVASKTGWITSEEVSSTYTFNAKPWSFVLLPDTQHYSETNPWIYEAQTQWALDNKTAGNIKAVLSLGDMVEHGSSGTPEVSRTAQASDPAYDKFEFVRAYKAMHNLDVASDLIWTPNFGNHDEQPYKVYEVQGTDVTEITLNLSNPTLTVGTRVQFWGNVPTGLVQGTRYWIKTAPTDTLFTVSLTNGGAAIDTAGSTERYIAAFENAASTDRTDNFNHYFPSGDFTSRWSGAFECRPSHTETSSVKFLVNGEKWMVITLPYAPVTADYTWTLSQIDANTDHKLILAPHSYLEGNLTRTPEGASIWTNVLMARPAANWVMVICGHRYTPRGWGYNTATLPNGKQVYQVLSDYQVVQPYGGAGWMRTMTFHPGMSKIIVKTFSPIANNGMGADWQAPDEEMNNFELDYSFECFTKGFQEASYGLINIKCGQPLLESPCVDVAVGTVQKKLSLLDNVGLVPETVLYDGDVEVLSNYSNIRDSYKGKGIFGLTSNDYWNVVKESQAQNWTAPRDARGMGNANSTFELRKYFNVTEAEKFFGTGIQDPNNVSAKTVTALENTGLKTADNQVLLHMRGINPGKYMVLAYGQKTDFNLDMYGGVCKSAGTGANANKGKAFYNFGHPIFHYGGGNNTANQYLVPVFPVKVFRLKGLKKITGSGNFEWVAEFVKSTFVPYSWWAKTGSAGLVTQGRALTGLTFIKESDSSVITTAGRVYLPHTSNGDSFNGYWEGSRRIARASAITDATGVIGSGYPFTPNDGWDILMVAPAFYDAAVPTIGGTVVPDAGNYVTSQMTGSGNLELSKIMVNAFVNKPKLADMLTLLWNEVYATGSAAWPVDQARWSLGSVVYTGP